MKNLLLLILVVGAAWYAYQRYPEVVSRRPAHEAVVANHTGRTMTRVRLTVDGQTFVKERLEDGADAKFEFRVANDSDFRLIWQWADAPGQFRWSGGSIPKGPMVQRHHLTIDGGNQVVYQARLKPGKVK
jgi:hypothetical protein